MYFYSLDFSLFLVITYQWFHDTQLIADSNGIFSADFNSCLCK